MINFNFNPHKKKKRNKRIHALGLKTVKSVTYSEMFTILLLKKKKNSLIFRKRPTHTNAQRNTTNQSKRNYKITWNSSEEQCTRSRHAHVYHYFLGILIPLGRYPVPKAFRSITSLLLPHQIRNPVDRRIIAARL